MAPRPKTVEARPAPRLYLITPPVSDPDRFAPDLDAALAAGDVAAVLLRLAAGDERTQINSAKALATPVQTRGAALLLDGHANLVARAGADGAHLSSLAAFTDALAALKPDRIAGAGDLPSRHDAMSAAEGGADYVLFGGAEADPAATKARVAWWAEVFEIPCIGFAARAEEIAPLVAAGADFVALDFVWQAPGGASAAIAALAPHLKLPETAS